MKIIHEIFILFYVVIIEYFLVIPENLIHEIHFECYSWKIWAAKISSYMVLHICMYRGHFSKRNI